MANANFTAHATQKTKSVSKEIRRSLSLKYRAGAINFSETSILDDFGMKRCIFYLKDNKEYRTAWFYSKDRAKRAFELIKAKYVRAIVYVD